MIRALVHQSLNCKQRNQTITMKLIIVALALVAFVAANPVPEVNIVEAILRSAFNKEADGGYQFGFETEKGIVREETGQLKDVPDEENKLHPVVVMRGSYSYINNDNKVETITYYADETGFHAEGDSIPKQA